MTMTTKSEEKAGHTRAPWTIHTEDEKPNYLAIRAPLTFGDGTFELASLRGNYVGKEANAALIVAAPKLLEVLKLTESWIVKHGLDKAELITGGLCEHPMLWTIRKAIAEAEGREA